MGIPKSREMKRGVETEEFVREVMKRERNGVIDLKMQR
jgi:hypothetical protein